MTREALPANHIPCEAGDGPVQRGEAVIRSNGLRQVGWHRDCYTVHRATEPAAVARLGGSLAERLAEAGLR